MAGTGNHVMMLLTFTAIMLFSCNCARRVRHHYPSWPSNRAPNVRVRTVVNVGNGKGRHVHARSHWFPKHRPGHKVPGQVGRFCMQKHTRRQPRDCRDVVSNGCRGNAVTWIKPRGTKGFWAYCEGAWTVIQRRWDGNVNFYRSWKDYARGFPSTQGGIVDPRHDFWVGNDNLHALTSQRKVKLKIKLWKQKAHMAQKNAYKYEQYVHFLVGNRENMYKLQVSGASGTAGDCLSSHSGMYFSTYDGDHDTWKKNCAKSYKGAWWYTACHSSNLNGIFYRSGVHKTTATGVNWSCSHGQDYSLRAVMMVY